MEEARLYGFRRSAANEYGKIRAYLERDGTPIDPSAWCEQILITTHLMYLMQFLQGTSAHLLQMLNMSNYNLTYLNMIIIQNMRLSVSVPLYIH